MSKRKTNTEKLTIGNHWKLRFKRNKEAYFSKKHGEMQDDTC
ncbi:MAG: hypothetical protein ACTSYA_10205 [Candidatus Kariarchaeaceae archaeon]